MITINNIIGNLTRDSKLKEKYELMLGKGMCEKVKINRLESQRLRMRKNTDKGSDVIFVFDHNPQLRHGDVVFSDDEKMIIVELEPEYVGIITLKNYNNNKDTFSMSIKIGHTLGNLHRPIQVTKNQVYFPLQAETEIEMVTKLFSSFSQFLDIKTDYMIFEPEEGHHIHEH